MNWQQINKNITACKKCPRLLAHCSKTAKEKRRSYLNDRYWGKPVPNFGDPKARLLIVGLAPAAHGANRTGRMFTGDRSGDWLYRALHKAGFANQKEAVSSRDGLKLTDCAITAACHCAPPLNKPTKDELENCDPYLKQTFAVLPVKVYLALGQIAWQGLLTRIPQFKAIPASKRKFSHGAVVKLPSGQYIVGSYHPSQQNTFTKRLTEPMFDSVFRTIKKKLAE